MRSGQFLQKGDDVWRGGSSGRHRSGSSRGRPRRKGNKLLGYLLLLLVIILAMVIWEILRSYGSGKPWYENIQPPPPDSDDG